jgi:hypothetical protein
MSKLIPLAVLARMLSGWSPLARGAWCRKQRRRLRIRGHSVVWIRGDAVPWAQWGARHGYFEVEQMDGLSYLRAVGAPIV